MVWSRAEGSSEMQTSFDGRVAMAEEKIACEINAPAENASQDEEVMFARKIARYVVGMKLEDVYEGGVEKANQCFLDTFGLALSASEFDAYRIMKDVVDEMGSHGSSLVLGSNEYVASYLAAKVNGIGSHVADYDDNSSIMTGHPSCVLVPAAFAAAEYAGASGKQMVEGFIVGFEVACALGRAAGWAHYNLGWHPTATFGSLAATCTCGKILGLTEDQMVHAFGIATSSVGGIRQNFGTMCKSFHAGSAASAALFAAQLAQKGFDASENCMEGASGYLKVMNCNEGDYGAFDRLGEDYVATLGHQFFKLYPSCAFTHTPVEAARQIKNENGIDPATIESVDCWERPVAETMLVHPFAKTGLEGKFSLNYTVSTMLLTDSLTIADFTDEAVMRPEIQAFMDKVHLHGRDEYDDMVKELGILCPCEVQITFDGGKKANFFLPTASGGFDNPASWEELEAKFNACVAPYVAPGQAEKIIGIAHRLDQLEDIKELQSALEIK